ncbi:MAG: adenylate/guanylate cyclase domain-containing protein [Casimicrobiaceae bacterium]
MASAPPNRRLAAVLFADVAGYSRLMERDETGTHKRVGMVFAEVIEPAIARHAGRFVSKAGDGILAEFLSSTAALQCAIEVQRQAEERTRSVLPRDQIRFRIGINVADILVDENDIVGGGVNLAARLETLARPGGICISQALKEQIQEDLGVEFVDCGTQNVKNISRPVHVFEVLPAPQTTLAHWRARVRQAITIPRWVWVAALGASLAGGLPASSRWTQTAEQEDLDRLSVAVLPFLSDAPDHATRELASALQRRLLMALTPESNMLNVKGLTADDLPSRRWDLNRVRADLKARYALVGDVTEIGRARRVDARLMDTTTGAIAWGDQFEIPGHLRYASFEVITKRLAPAIVNKVFELEMKRIKSAPPANPDPLDLIFLGYAELVGRTGDSLQRAEERFRQAQTINGKFVPALVALAYVLEIRSARSSGSPESAALLREAERLTLAAVANDPECAASWVMRSSVLASMGQHEAALAAAEKAVRINPTSADAHLQYTSLLIGMGRSNEVIRPLDEVKLIYEKFMLIDFARLQCQARIDVNRLDDALAVCETWYALGGGDASLHAVASVHRQRGNAVKEAKVVAELVSN